MRIYSAHLDLSGALERAHTCPRCGSTGLVAEPDDERTSFFCRDCHQCWRFEAGDLVAVDPLTCGHSRRHGEHPAEQDDPDPGVADLSSAG